MAHGIPEGIIGTRDEAHIAQLLELVNRVAGCRDCLLHKYRNRAVFGTGHADADVLVIGEGPGANEDRLGIPFCGLSGQLLRSVLDEMNEGLGAKVFISNAVRCRPPENRDPYPSEILSCRPHLDDLVDLIRPNVILAVGRMAASAVTNISPSRARISRLREDAQRGYQFGGIPVMFTFHPAYVRRNPEALGYFKKDVKETLLYGSSRPTSSDTAAPEEEPA